MFPVWLKFRGGKGVATGFGVFLVAAPWAALAAIGVFFVVLAMSRYVSLASILGAASFPVFAWFLVQGERPPLLSCRAGHRRAADHRQTPPEHPPPACRHGIPLWSQKARMSRIVVFGSGAWGTAIALSLHRRGGHQVTLWAHSPEAAQADHRRRREHALSSRLSHSRRTRHHRRLRRRRAMRRSWFPLSPRSFCAPPSPAWGRICTPAKSSSAPPKAWRTTPSCA